MFLESLLLLLLPSFFFLSSTLFLFYFILLVLFCAFHNRCLWFEWEKKQHQQTTNIPGGRTNIWTSKKKKNAWYRARWRKLLAMKHKSKTQRAFFFFLFFLFKDKDLFLLIKKCSTWCNEAHYIRSKQSKLWDGQPTNESYCASFSASMQYEPPSFFFFCSWPFSFVVDVMLFFFLCGMHVCFVTYVALYARQLRAYPWPLTLPPPPPLFSSFATWLWTFLALAAPECSTHVYLH